MTPEFTPIENDNLNCLARHNVKHNLEHCRTDLPNPITMPNLFTGTLYAIQGNATTCGGIADVVAVRRGSEVVNLAFHANPGNMLSEDKTHRCARSQYQKQRTRQKYKLLTFFRLNA